LRGRPHSAPPAVGTAGGTSTETLTEPTALFLITLGRVWTLWRAFDSPLGHCPKQGLFFTYGPETDSTGALPVVTARARHDTPKPAWQCIVAIVSDFEDESATIAEEAMSRLAATDEVAGSYARA